MFEKRLKKSVKDYCKRVSFSINTSSYIQLFSKISWLYNNSWWLLLPALHLLCNSANYANVLQIAKLHFRYTVWLKYYEVHVSSLWWRMHVQKAKVSTNKEYKKIVCQNFKYFQPLKITLMCTYGFYNRYEHVWRNIKTFLEENCAVAFGQLLLIY